jgi:hypothetical protein
VTFTLPDIASGLGDDFDHQRELGQAGECHLRGNGVRLKLHIAERL